MKDLAFLTSPDMSKTEVATTHIVIAEYAGLNKISVRKLIDNNIADLEQFGRLSFEMTALEDSRGQKVKVYQLNRNQAMLVISWLDNTEPVKAFKLALVKRFDELEKTIQNWIVLKINFKKNYFSIEATEPAPTVRPPSRIENLVPFSIATG